MTRIPRGPLSEETEIELLKARLTEAEKRVTEVESWRANWVDKRLASLEAWRNWTIGGGAVIGSLIGFFANTIKRHLGIGL